MDSVTSIGNLISDTRKKLRSSTNKPRSRSNWGTCRCEYESRTASAVYLSFDRCHEASSRTREPLGPATRSNNIGSPVCNRESLSTEASRNDSTRGYLPIERAFCQCANFPSRRINNPSKPLFSFFFFFFTELTRKNPRDTS